MPTSAARELAETARARIAPTLDVAIAGTRGVPARYGGFETFAAELAPRLVARGHRVTVYAREGYVSSKRRRWRGVDVRVLPRVRSKHLDTPGHALASALAALARPEPHDVVLLCNAACAPVVPLLRARGTRVVLNVDGIERLRRKWGVAGKLWYRAGEKLALSLADRCVADARAIADYYREHHGRELETIAYGADPAARVEPGAALAMLELAPDGYILVVTRLEPENNASLVARAFRRVGGSRKLVVVGDAPYERSEKAELARLAAEDARIVLAGAVYGRRARELFSHAFAYVQPTEIGGTHPALLQGMALSPAVVANDVPEHREVLGECGLYYSRNDEGELARVLGELGARPDDRTSLGARARERIHAAYSWERVTDDYERVFLTLDQEKR